MPPVTFVHQSSGARYSSCTSPGRVARSCGVKWYRGRIGRRGHGRNAGSGRANSTDCGEEGRKTGEARRDNRASSRRAGHGDELLRNHIELIARDDIHDAGRADESAVRQGVVRDDGVDDHWLDYHTLDIVTGMEYCAGESWSTH